MLSLNTVTLKQESPVGTSPADDILGKSPEGLPGPPEVVATAIPPTNVTVFSPPTDVEEVPATPPPTDNRSEVPTEIPLPASPHLPDVEPIDNAPPGVTETSQFAPHDRSNEHNIALPPNVTPSPEEPLPEIESAPSSVDPPKEPANEASQPNLSIPTPLQSEDTNTNHDTPPAAPEPKSVGHVPVSIALVLIFDHIRNLVPSLQHLIPEHLKLL